MIYPPVNHPNTLYNNSHITDNNKLQLPLIKFVKLAVFKAVVQTVKLIQGEI